MDKFYKNDARLFVVMENRVQATGIWTAAASSGPVADALAKEMPEAEYTTATAPADGVTLSVPDDKNAENIRADGHYAGKGFFNIFSYDLIEGNANQVLTDKKSIVLSDVLAMKLFGTTANSIGKAVDFQHQEPYIVSGVFREPGLHSSDRFDFVLSIQILKDMPDGINNWWNTGYPVYLTVKPGTDINRFNAKMAGFVKRNTNNEITYRTPFIKRYSDNYLYGRYQDGIQSGGRRAYVHLFSIIAIFILVIACINFMNLSTAKASGRSLAQRRAAWSCCFQRVF